MKYKFIKAVLLISTFSLSIIFVTGCGKEKSTDVDTNSFITSAITSTEDVAESIAETLEGKGIDIKIAEPVETIDPRLDTTVAGTYYIINEDQNLYEESNQSSEVVETYPVDSEIRVSGIYGDTGFFQVVDADENILGYVDSVFCDSVKGGYIPEDETSDIPQIADNSSGNVESPSTQVDPYDSQSVLDMLIGSDGIIGSFDGSQYGGGQSYDVQPVDPNDFGLGTGEGLTTGVVLD